MNVKVKFLRRLGDRPHRSDRSIWLRAVLAAVVAQLVFWCVFSYRTPRTAVRQEGSSVSLLDSSDLTPELRRWLDHHDPANVVRSDFRGGYAALLPTAPPRFEVPVPRVVTPSPSPVPKLRAFRKLPVDTAPSGVCLPLAARPSGTEPGDGGVRVISDELGRVLPLDGVKLPFRSAKVRGDTVLRMLRIGELPTLVVESSCGDPELDLAATGLPIMRLAELEPPPQYIVVRWPEAPAGKGGRP